MGRPSTYSSKLVGIICERIANGQSVREVARDKAMPAMSTIFKWLAEQKEFSEQYARAKEAQAEFIAEEMLEIADDGSNDWQERQSKDGELAPPQVNGEHIQRSRLRVDTRKWLLSKLLPKKYGDKLGVEHSGGLAISHEEALAQLK